jgi:hypothetical protein
MTKKIGTPGWRRGDESAAIHGHLQVRREVAERDLRGMRSRSMWSLVWTADDPSAVSILQLTHDADASSGP